jgi:hypothetical protein
LKKEGINCKLKLWSTWGNCEEGIKEVVKKGTRGLQLAAAAWIAWNIL